jgi:DNA-binding MarR family transcriptional regulator
MKNTEDISAVRHCACANIRRADRVITGFYDEILAPSGLRTTQFTLLATLAQTGSMTINGLAEVMVMDRTTLTRNLGPLTKQGLVQVEEGADRRTRQVHLTSGGEQALRRALPLWQQAQSHVVHALGQEQFDHLLTDLSVLQASVK